MLVILLANALRRRSITSENEVEAFDCKNDFAKHIGGDYTHKALTRQPLLRATGPHARYVSAQAKRGGLVPSMRTGRPQAESPFVDKQIKRAYYRAMSKQLIIEVIILTP